MNDEFINDCKDKSNSELARKYKVSERTIRRWRKKAKESIPAPTTKVYDDFVTVESDKVMVIGDIEIPFHSTDTLEMACALARKYELDTLIINGDLVALDCFSTWVRNTAYKLTFKNEIEPALEILKIFLTIFNQIYIVTGNHERRLARKLDGEITIGEFFSNISGVTFSEYSYCILNSGGEEILVCHQDNYSKQPLAVSRELASIYHKHIIAGHTHHLAQGYDKSGKYWVVDGGCCRDTKYTEYKSIRVNTFPKWNNGVVMVINGSPLLVDMGNANFWLA